MLRIRKAGMIGELRIPYPVSTINLESGTKHIYFDSTITYLQERMCERGLLDKIY